MWQASTPTALRVPAPAGLSAPPQIPALHSPPKLQSCWDITQSACPQILADPRSRNAVLRNLQSGTSAHPEPGPRATQLLYVRWMLCAFRVGPRNAHESCVKGQGQGGAHASRDGARSRDGDAGIAPASMPVLRAGRG